MKIYMDKKSLWLVVGISASRLSLLSYEENECINSLPSATLMPYAWIWIWNKTITKLTDVPKEALRYIFH